MTADLYLQTRRSVEIDHRIPRVLRGKAGSVNLQVEMLGISTDVLPVFL
jgi:hypothetical protein